ncbi:MAG: ABC transporter substrate-binding protein [Calditrichaceae bacterium]|nr:ABC transporter substrate-binding protein [Calditrichaceae bacterium]MBN2709009.1 ABC transporter substrate-binding protein [Calditrichaceae bacterium]
MSFFKIKIFYLFTLFVFFSLLCCGPTDKQNKQFKVGILCGLDYTAEVSSGFKTKMTALGYKEKEDISYDFYSTNFNPQQEQQIIKNFIRDKVDMILTFPTEVSMTAKNMTRETDIPVIFAVANIEETNLIDNVTKPGKNITGIRFPGPDLAIKRFEVMRELAPKARRYWLPYQRGYPIIDSQLKVIYPVAQSAGITIVEFPADDAKGIRAELERIKQTGSIGFDAIFFIPEPLSCIDEAFLVMAEFAYEHKLPIGGALIQVGDYGSLYGINVDLQKTGEQAAILADKIFRGTPAGSIPVVSSESYLEINYKAAQDLGVTIPEGLISRADRIIR